MSAPDARAFSDLLSAQRPQGPDVGEVIDGTLPGPGGDLDYRLYRPATPGPHPVVVYFHGGGWVLGGASSDDPFCRDLCVRLNAVIVSADYRHSPEVRFPGPVDDAIAATRWVADHAAQLGGIEGRLAVAGWSAGANLAAVVAQVRLGLRPLFALSQEIADLRSGRADQLGGDYPSELTPLSDQLNALVRHNRESLERQRAHVGNLAHALKTPLAVLSAAAGSDSGPLANLVTQQAGVMQTQVDHHLRRARAAARLPGAGAVTPVAEVLDDLSRTLMRLHQEAGVRIDWDAPDDLVFLGERQDLLEICGNLMENACKWGRGRITVGAAASGPDRLVLEIDDNGPGLGPAQRREALARGGRLDETAPGSGLGLSIVSDLVRAYGGGLDLSDSPMGGLRVRLDLPRSAD